MRQVLHYTLIAVIFAAMLQLGCSSASPEPRAADDYFRRGVERQSKGDNNGAIADYTKAIELDPRHFSAYNNRGNTRRDKGDLRGAIADYNRAIEINPQHAPAYFNRGYAMQSRRDYTGAIYEYTKAIEFNPRYAQAYANRGLSHLYMDETDEAQKDFDQCLAIDPNLKGTLEGFVAEVRKQQAALR